MTHKIFVRICRLSLCCIILSSNIHAQEDPGVKDSSQRDKKKPFFTCLYWEGLPMEPLYYRQGEEFLPIKFEDSRRSQAYLLKRMSNFELYRDAKQPKDDQPPYDLLANTVIPSGSSQILLLVIPFQKKSSEELNYKVIAMDDSLSAFPLGTFRFVNFTQLPLLVKFAGEVKKLPAKKMTVMSCKPGKGGGFRPFIIGNAEGKQIFGTKLFGQASGRELVFISPPLRSGSNTPRVKFITQLMGTPIDSDQ